MEKRKVDTKRKEIRNGMDGEKCGKLELPLRAHATLAKDHGVGDMCIAWIKNR